MKTLISKKLKKGIKTSDIELFDARGNLIYSEDCDGYWWLYRYDKNNNPIYVEHCDGWWRKSEFDEKGYAIYTETSSNGVILGERPKSMKK